MRSVLSGNLAATPSQSGTLDISGDDRDNYFVALSGNIGAGDVAVEVSVDVANTVWVPVYSQENSQLTFGAVGGRWFRAAGYGLRLSLTGGAAPDLDYVVYH